MAFISPATDTEPAPSNAEEERPQELTRWTRILRFFSSGRLQLIPSQRPQGVPNDTAGGFRMDRSNIMAKGNVSIGVTVNNYAGGSGSHQNQSTVPSSSTDPQTSQAITRPKFLEGLPQFSIWDVLTEERLGDTGFCRVYSAKVNSKRTLVKEFYGENAAKDWVTTARFHAATHFMPEFLRLVGTSRSREGTEDENEPGMNPFLLLECDDLQPWDAEDTFGRAANPLVETDGIGGVLLGVLLIHDISDIIMYLTDVSMLDSATTPDIEVYQRPSRPNARRSPSHAQPVVAFNFPGSPGPPCRFTDLLALLKTAIFGEATGIGIGISDPDGGRMMASLYSDFLMDDLAKRLKIKYGLV